MTIAVDGAPKVTMPTDNPQPRRGFMAAGSSDPAQTLAQNNQVGSGYLGRAFNLSRTGVLLRHRAGRLVPAPIGQTKGGHYRWDRAAVDRAAQLVSSTKEAAQ